MHYRTCSHVTVKVMTLREASQLSSTSGQMLAALSGELPTPLMILGDQPGTNQERFGDLTDGPCWESQHRCQNVQSRGTMQQDEDGSAMIGGGG